VYQDHVDTCKIAQVVWANTINMTVYLINKGPMMSLNYGISKEAWIEKEVNLNRLCIFGCISYVHVELDHRSKLDPKSKRCIVIRYRISEYVIDFEIHRTERSLGIRMWY